MKVFRRRQPKPAVAPVQSAMKHRDAFVAEVAETIRARHSVEDESFVFGLSGRWGEGKTHFLKRLRTELEAKKFEIVELNPWKFADDRVAFLRAFLVHLLKDQPKKSRWSAAWNSICEGRWETAREMIIPRRYMLAKLRTDVTRRTISWLRLLLLFAIAAFAYWVVMKVLSQAHRDALGFWKAPAAVLFLAMAVWVAQGVVESQTSSRAVTAVDDFDGLVNLALGGSSATPECARPREIVVFVDDLDRVTASVARGVLDNLRTFFDKPALSFVVTGDHSVLESNLGRELAPGEDPVKQREQGRLFLKKVFNVYWRLPIPVPSDFESYVDAELEERAKEVAKVIEDDEDKQQLRAWLIAYCNRNLRQVERFLDTFLFSLALVHAQLKTANDDERHVLDEMVNRPLLLGRVLMVQDNCNPFFDLLTTDASLLLELDRELQNAQSDTGSGESSDVVARYLDRLTSAPAQGEPRLRLTGDQRDFLVKFAYESPRFSDSSGQVVSDLAPWIHLASDTTFGDESGPLPEDFVRSLENMNGEAIAISLERCSETRSKPVAEKTAKTLSEDADVAQRGQRLNLLLAQLSGCDSSAPLARQLVECLTAALEPITAGLPDNERVAVLVSTLALLGQQGQESIPETAAQVFAFRAGSDLQHLPDSEFGSLASGVVLGWLDAYYSENASDTLGYLTSLLPRLDLEHQSDMAASIGKRLATDVLGDADAGRRTSRLHLVTEHFSALLPEVTADVITAIDRQDVWDWAGAEAANGTSPWSQVQLEDALIVWVRGAGDPSELSQRLRYAAGKLDGRSSDLWRGIAEDRIGDVVELLEPLVSDQSFYSLAMPADVATRLYEGRVSAVKLLADSGNEADAVSLAQRLLDPSHWIWSSVDANRPRKSMRYMARPGARHKQLQGVLRPFWERWKELDKQ